MSPKPKSGMGAKMAGGNPAQGRQQDDFYATPWAVTRALYLYYESILKGAIVWEPCAGDGAMANALLDYGVRQVICSDIAPKPQRRVTGPVITQGDALAIKSMPAVDAVITNPPFNIAPDLIHKMLTVAGGPPPFLALVLKSTFWHARSRKCLFDRFRPTAVHPLRWRPDFLKLGAPTMEVMWCVWKYSPHDTEKYETSYIPFDHPPPV